MIPETSATKYLTGISALNIPSQEGTGDWHMYATLIMDRVKEPPLLLAGEGQKFSTLEYLGVSDIIDCTTTCQKAGIPYLGEKVFAANHFRAIADMVIFNVLNGIKDDKMPLDDWLNTDEQKQRVFTILSKCKKFKFYKDIESWSKNFQD